MLGINLKTIADLISMNLNCHDIIKCYINYNLICKKKNNNNFNKKEKKITIFEINSNDKFLLKIFILEKSTCRFLDF